MDPSEVQLEPKKSWFSHHIILGIVFVVVITAAIVSAIYYWQVVSSIPEPFQPVVHKDATSQTATQSLTKDLPDQHLFKATCAGSEADFSYLQVNASTLPPGQQLIEMVGGCATGLGFAPDILRFLFDGKKYILLQKYSPLLKDFSAEFDQITPAQFTIDTTTDIPLLDFPNQVMDPKTNSVLKLISDPNSLTPYNNLNNVPLFTDNLKRSAFAVSGEQNEDFNIPASDGTILTYQLSDPFLIGQNLSSTTPLNLIHTLKIHWNDNATHSNSFEYDPAGDYSKNDSYDMSTCIVGQDYVNAVKKYPVSLVDLKIAATNDAGQPVYVLKDSQNPLLVAARAQIKNLNNVYQNNKPVSDNTVDIIVFWQDPFGRLVRFVSTSMTDACGA